MNRKDVAILFVCLLMFSFLVLFVCLLMFSFLVMRVESAEPPLACQGWYDHLSWEVRAPEEVKIGDEFSVVFKFEPFANLDVDRINVTVYGNIGSQGAWDIWEYSWSNTRWHYGAIYTRAVHFIIAKEGGAYVDIYAVYDAMGERHVGSTNFHTTTMYARTYQELESDYDLLNQSYVTLQENHNSLEVILDSTRTLMYFLMIPTVVFIITTIYFAVRKPKVKAT